MHDLDRLAETNSTKTASAWASATSRTRYLQWIAVWQDSEIPAESLSHLPSLWGTELKNNQNNNDLYKPL